MNYTSIDSLKNAWVFRHKSLPISTQDLALIKPMTSTRANVLWDNSISRQVDHPDFFKNGDWPHNDKVWYEQGKWEPVWDSETPQLPELIMNNLLWDKNTVVYFCSSRNHIIETTWDVFQRCWKNFLFMDDGPLLIGKKRDQVVQFLSNGTFKLGDKKLITQ